jgi:hypothetical protein
LFTDTGNLKENLMNGDVDTYANNDPAGYEGDPFLPVFAEH